MIAIAPPATDIAAATMINGAKLPPGSQSGTRETQSTYVRPTRKSHAAPQPTNEPARKDAERDRTANNTMPTKAATSETRPNEMDNEAIVPRTAPATKRTIEGR
jgi:hypothetical protein